MLEHVIKRQILNGIVCVVNMLVRFLKGTLDNKS